MALYTIGLGKMTAADPDGKPPGFIGKMLLGSGAGGVASLCGVPADVVMVRMAADAKEPDPTKVTVTLNAANCCALQGYCKK